MMELLAGLEGSALSVWVREAPTIWAYPTILTLHTLGLAVLVGANIAVDLRVLGFGRHIPLAPMEKFFPVMWMGFWPNAVTGALLFATDPIKKGTTLLFMAKLGCVAAGIVLMVLLRRSLFGRDRDPVTVTPLSTTYAALSLCVWLGAIVTGRLMAYWV